MNHYQLLNIIEKINLLNLIKNMNHYQLLNIIEKINIIKFNKKYESLSTFKYNRKNKYYYI
jgi:hypothetical protein